MLDDRLGSIVHYKDRPRQRSLQQRVAEAGELRQLELSALAELASSFGVSAKGKSADGLIAAIEQQLATETVAAAAAAAAAPVQQTDSDLAIEAGLSDAEKASIHASTTTAPFTFPLSCPNLRMFSGDDAQAAHSRHVPMDREAELKVQRPRHPVTNSEVCFLCHDRFHGQGHKYCQHRSPSLIAEMTRVNTNYQEQFNRSMCFSICDHVHACQTLTVA